MIQQSHSWGYTQRNALQVVPKAPAHHVYCSAIHNSQVIETAKIPHNQQIDGENVVFIHNRILQPQRKMKFCHSQVNGWNRRTSS
jgi:hypothetical protein